MSRIDDCLGADGALAERMDGFVARDEQIAFARDVEQAIAKHERLIVEAGTGTGKTFAYLIPALQSGKKVIIATGTRNLQDQLYHRDLPRLRKYLGLPAKVALLKGRANYLCHYRLFSMLDTQTFISKDQAALFQHIQSHAELSDAGDIAELGSIAEDDPVWPSVTSTAENCLGTECPYASDCFVTKARRKALQADVLVINHHLFFADLVIREEGITPLLPNFSAIIFDEAHQLPEVASIFFGEHISSRQIILLTQDIQSECVLLGDDMPMLRDYASSLPEYISQLRHALGADNQKGSWYEIAKKTEVANAITQVQEQFEGLIEELKQFGERSKGLQRCLERAYELLARLKSLTAKTPNEFIHWFETYRKSFQLHLTPMAISDRFIEQVENSSQSWIFTSATLTCDNDFQHYQQAMGLASAKTRCYDSPFDYEKQSLLYVPHGLPDPFAQNYMTHLIESIIPVLIASKGQCFFLFTSHRALRLAAELLPPRVRFPILIQGTKPKAQLLQDFIEKPSVLLGTASFWEGVDVKGEALSCVIIDKLPFASHHDPVMQGRLKRMREKGQEPFNHYQLPQAIISLRQGVGRLIRDKTDKGVVVIADPRMITRDYGKHFIDSLPNMPLTRDLARVKQFFQPSEPESADSMSNDALVADMPT